MGKCLTVMNCNDNENTRVFETYSNNIEFEENQLKESILNKEVNTENEIKFSQIVLSIGNMLISSSTYSYILKPNSNLEEFINIKLKGISGSNQLQIGKFIFENIRLKDNLPLKKSGHEVIVNCAQSLTNCFNDLPSYLNIDNSKTGLNKVIIKIVFHLTEIYHFISYQSIVLNQKRDEYYNCNYWINIEDVIDYFNTKIAETGQNLENIKAFKNLK